MARLGIPNTAFGADWFGSHDFVSAVRAALSHGIPVLFGLSAAYRLYDNWTASEEDAGVYGHGITLVGMDSSGAIVADPNTAQALSGDFVHYTWDNLRAAEGDWPSMVIPARGAIGMAVPQGWTDANGVITAPNKVEVMRGFAQYIRDNDWEQDDYPLENETWMNPLELQNPALGAGSQQVFRKTMLEWNEKLGVARAWVGGELLVTRKALATANAAREASDKALGNPQQAAAAAAAAASATQTALQQQISGLQAQVANLQAQIASSPPPNTPVPVNPPSPAPSPIPPSPSTTGSAGAPPGAPPGVPVAPAPPLTPAGSAPVTAATGADAAPRQLGAPTAVSAGAGPSGTPARPARWLLWRRKR